MQMSEKSKNALSGKCAKRRMSQNDKFATAAANEPKRPIRHRSTPYWLCLGKEESHSYCTTRLPRQIFPRSSEQGLSRKHAVTTIHYICFSSCDDGYWLEWTSASVDGGWAWLGGSTARSLPLHSFQYLIRTHVCPSTWSVLENPLLTAEYMHPKAYSLLPAFRVRSDSKYAPKFDDTILGSHRCALGLDTC